MTLSVAWVREVGPHTEMIFASDSRLSQGGTWDAGPKVMPLARTDALVVFAGATLWAYPFMLQVASAVQAFTPWRERHRDLREVPRRVRDVMNGMLEHGDTFREGYNSPLTELLLGGWSWQSQQFLLWRFHWVEAERAFRHESIPRRALGLCGFIGDQSDEDRDLDVVRFARRRLRELLDQRGKLEGPLDMEPFEVLTEVIREDRFYTVGGPPQLAKIYRHMNTQLFAVRWPDAGGALTYGGRELLPHEAFGAPEMDPDQPAVHSRTTRQAAQAAQLAQAGAILMARLESVGRAKFEDLVEWASDERLVMTDDEIRGWVQDAAESGKLARFEDGLLGWPDADRVPESDEES